MEPYGRGGRELLDFRRQKSGGRLAQAVLRLAGFTDELITDYRLVDRLEGKEVGSETVAGNHLRQRVHSAGGVICDEIRVEIPPVNRCTACRIYEIRVYA